MAALKDLLAQTITKTVEAGVDIRGSKRGGRLGSPLFEKAPFESFAIVFALFC